MFNAAHLHLMLNHLPIIGSVILLFFFTHAVIFKKENVIKISLIFYVIISVLALLVYLTGDPSEEIIKKLPGVNESIIEVHENYAFISLLVFLFTGAISLLGLLLFNKKNIPAGFKFSALFLFFISVVIISYTAKTGGEIMHPEISSNNYLLNQTDED